MRIWLTFAVLVGTPVFVETMMDIMAGSHNMSGDRMGRTGSTSRAGPVRNRVAERWPSTWEKQRCSERALSPFVHGRLRNLK
jgi:hypothetical protein